MEYHEAANIFPIMEGAWYEELKRSIEVDGVSDPTTWHENKVLDGRNRERACEELGVKCPREQWDCKGTAIEFVIRKNLLRRQLTSGQRAMAVAAPEVFAYFKRMAEKRKEGGQKKGGGDHRSAKAKTASPPKGGQAIKKRDKSGEATVHAAKAVNTSSRSVNRARRIHEHGSKKLVAATIRGEVRVTTAARLTEKKPKRSEQDKILSRGKKAVHKAAGKPRPTKKRRELNPIPKQIDALLASVENLIHLVQCSPKGVGNQRNRCIDDLRICRKRIRQASNFLM